MRSVVIIDRGLLIRLLHQLRFVQAAIGRKLSGKHRDLRGHGDVNFSAKV